MIKKLIGILVCAQLIFTVIPTLGYDLVERNSFELSFGNTLYVGGSGPGNYTRIQDAIDDAQAGDTILIFNGTYNEHITINKQLFFRGFKEVGKDLPTINGGNDDDTVVIYADGCTFEHLKVRNGPSGFGQIGIILFSNNNTIKNCTSFNTGTGLLMSSSSNNTVLNNELYDGWNGIVVEDSSSNTFVDNHIYSHNTEEIRISGQSSNNSFYFNVISSNEVGNGVRCGGRDNQFIRNTISYNHRVGMIVEGSNITVVDNIFIDDGLIIYSSTPQQWCSHTIENNTINGRLIYYYTNTKNVTVPEDAGQVLIGNCSDFLVQNLNISNIDTAILIKFSSNITITNCVLSSHFWYGIHLSQTSNCTISYNIITNCYSGIFLVYSENTIISNNTVREMFNGIDLESSSYNEISNNTVSFNDRGILLCDSSNNTVIGNEISSNELDGIFLYGRYVWIFNNNISKNVIRANLDIGINIVGSKNATIADNIIKNNRYGIYSEHSHKQNIIRNKIQGNIHGVYLKESTQNYITQNNFIRNIRNARFDFNYYLGMGPYNRQVEGPSSIDPEKIDMNSWHQNYWNRPRVLPKIIMGTLKIWSYVRGFGFVLIFLIPLMNCDFDPLHNLYSDL